MPLALNTTLQISCEASEEQSGPTIVHSSGVESYRVSPEVIRLLQESCTNEKLSDNDKGVQCTDPAAHILSVFERAGFSVTAETKSGSRKLWILTKTSEGGSSNPSNPAAPPNKPGGKPTEQEEEEQADEEEEEEEEEK